MEIDKSLMALKKLGQKPLGTGQSAAHAETVKSIDPQVDRSRKNNDFIAEQANSQIDNSRDPRTQPCRDCPEGMQW